VNGLKAAGEASSRRKNATRDRIGSHKQMRVTKSMLFAGGL
jgi:hypothetical protein